MINNHTSYGFVFPRRAVLANHSRDLSNKYKKLYPHQQQQNQQQQHQQQNSRSAPGSAVTGNFRNPIQRVGNVTNSAHFMRLPASKRYN